MTEERITGIFIGFYVGAVLGLIWAQFILTSCEAMLAPRLGL